LERANLHAANLRESIFGCTSFESTNLQAALGLDTCQHEGHSQLDIETLVQSVTLPETFLRGCGWSEELIIQVMALLHNVQGDNVPTTLVEQLRAWKPLVD
jgi:hypothetical protein